MPGSEKFNRGSMGLEELISRIHVSGSKAALVITHYRGNPGDILIYDSSGNEHLRIRLESAVLRREVLPDRKIRIHGVHSVTVEPESSSQTLGLAREIASLLDFELQETDEVRPVGDEGRHRVDIRFSDIDKSKTLWTHYHAADGVEVGPRIRVKFIRWSSE